MLQFWPPQLGGPPFWYSKFCQIYLSFMFTCLTNFVVKRLKSLNFGGPVWGETLIIKPLILITQGLSDF